MYKLIASIVVVLAILFTWYITKDSTSVPVNKQNDGGIILNQ